MRRGSGRGLVGGASSGKERCDEENGLAFQEQMRRRNGCRLDMLSLACAVKYHVNNIVTRLVVA